MKDDHPDAVQFWTTNTKVPASDIIVEDNVIVRGKGSPIQGIFFRDELGTLPYQNVTIADNLVIGALYNGITIMGGVGFKITGNVVAALPDMLSRIRLEDASQGQVSGNKAFAFLYDKTSSITQTNNEQIPYLQDGGRDLLQSWLGSAAPAPKPAPDPSPIVLGPVAPEPAPAAPAAPQPTITTLLRADGQDRLVALNRINALLIGGAGNDTLDGGTGETVLRGGTGNDSYTVRTAKARVEEAAGEGSDTVFASVDYVLPGQVETLYLSGAARNGTGNALDNRIDGTSSADRLYGLGGNDLMQGKDGNDEVHGGDGNDDLRGEAGEDMLVGGAGADKLYGGAGYDWLLGGEGNDWLEGGAGCDKFTGGAGADSFVFRTGDLPTSFAEIEMIQDFSRVEGDKICLTLIDSNPLTAARDKFLFIGTESFSGVAGQLRYETVLGHAYVSGDLNGDGRADFTLCVAQTATLQATDFML